jgi:hypothetical protein
MKGNIFYEKKVPYKQFKIAVVKFILEKKVLFLL